MTTEGGGLEEGAVGGEGRGLVGVPWGGEDTIAHFNDVTFSMKLESIQFYLNTIQSK